MMDDIHNLDGYTITNGHEDVEIFTFDRSEVPFDKFTLLIISYISGFSNTSRITERHAVTSDFTINESSIIQNNFLKNKINILSLGASDFYFDIVSNLIIFKVTGIVDENITWRYNSKIIISQNS